jgi:phosphoglycolate phosphatase
LTKKSWPQAIVFDLDGTLVDSAPDLADALNNTLDRYFAQPLPVADVRLMIGAGVPKLIERGIAAHGGSADEYEIEERLVPDFMAHYLANATNKTLLYPGAMDLLQSLTARSIKIGLCTNKPTDVSTQILSDLGVGDFFSAIVGGTSGYPKKPDPASMHACLSELGVGTRETLYVGDSATDVKLAANVGLPVVLVRGGYTKEPVEELGGNLVVDSLSEINQAIEIINTGKDPT